MTEQGSNLQQMIANNVAGTKRGASKHTKRCLKLKGFAWKECIPQMKRPSKRKTTFTTTGVNLFPTNSPLNSADPRPIVLEWSRHFYASNHQLHGIRVDSLLSQTLLCWAALPLPPAHLPPMVPYPTRNTFSQTPNPKKTKCINIFRQRRRNHPVNVTWLVANHGNYLVVQSWSLKPPSLAFDGTLDVSHCGDLMCNHFCSGNKSMFLLQTL